MIQKKKKTFYLILVTVLVSGLVYMLFPAGNQLLLLARQQSTKEIPHGQEIIYTYIDRGDIEVADKILHGEYSISRFESVKIEDITWTEDPYGDAYWRFNFYNLEPARHLLYAWNITEDPEYRDKLIDLTTSFIDNGMESEYAWDLHGAAFRTMTLINIWTKLNDKSALPIDLSKKIRTALVQHGDFLADPTHYEGSYNHGLDQSAALYLLAINFPELQTLTPGTQQEVTWRKLATDRLTASLDNIIDPDGILVENSPYYHFYVLDKMWEIRKFQTDNGLPVIPTLDEKLEKMITYATYILQPNQLIPTVGASLEEEIELSGVYSEIAAQRSDLLYVLTKGAKGKVPAAMSMHYPSSGQTIMRSGWSKGEDYTNQTQLIFDVGSYRTNHSDLDALSFNLYSRGMSLMPDAGLYTYAPGIERDYFHGTQSHNTVVVDGKDQMTGNNTDSNSGVYAGQFEKGADYVYQSGRHNLYEGVVHERSIMLIEDSNILIVDQLESKDEHSYEQMFHLFPGAKVSTSSLTLIATGETPEQTITIQQFKPRGVSLETAFGQSDPYRGFCSKEYTEAVPCHTVSYSQTGTNVTYLTLITIGPKKPLIIIDAFADSLRVGTDKALYDITMDSSPETKRDIQVQKNFNLSDIYTAGKWEYILNSPEGWQNVSTKPALGDTDLFNPQTASLELKPPADGSYLAVEKEVSLNLRNDNLYFRVMSNSTRSLEGLDFYVSNNNWKNSARINLRSGTYDVNRDGEWIQFNVNKSQSRSSSLGGWITDNPGFDWGNIDSVKFIASAYRGTQPTVRIKDFQLIPNQTESRAVIIFDDGWSSVLDALPLMKQYGAKGNVGVITNSVGTSRYLSLNNLKTLQNEHGWNMVNHTSLHKNALQDYLQAGDTEGYVEDITSALSYLIKNDLNSAPNWFIYPHGKTDEAAKDIIGNYYKFARATLDKPESFPFAEPLEVRAVSIYSDRTSLSEVRNIISDAAKYNQTIMLMFHKLTTDTPEEYHEWQLSDLETILQDLHNQGVKVVTLSELDAENGIPQTEFTLTEHTPGQLKLDVAVTSYPTQPQNLSQKIANWFQK